MSCQRDGVVSPLVRPLKILTGGMIFAFLKIDKTDKDVPGDTTPSR